MLNNDIKINILNMDRYTIIWKAIQRHGYKYDYREINSCKARDKISYICPIHGRVTQIVDNHFKHECNKCSKEKSAHRSNTEEFIYKANLANGFRYIYNKTVYIRAKDDVIVTCPIHGDFKVRANHHLNGTGCKYCNFSKLVNKIRSLLTLNNIRFENEYTFDWLKYNNNFQFLDFYLPDLNIAIECQGEQHFKPIEHFGGIEAFNKTIDRDLNKLTLCREHNLRIIYISERKHKNFLNEPVIYNNNEKLLKEIKGE